MPTAALDSTEQADIRAEIGGVLTDGLPNVYGAVHLDFDARYSISKPSLGEFAETLKEAGWLTPADDRFPGELAFSTDWARLSTLSNPRLIRFSGQVEPARWEELHTLLTGFGWDVGMSCHEPRGGDLVQKFPPAREIAR